MYRSVSVSAISLKPTKWDKASNAEKLEAFFVEAAKDSPQLILATEGVLEGYVVMDVIEGKAPPEAMLDIANRLTVLTSTDSVVWQSNSKPVSASVSRNGVHRLLSCGPGGLRGALPPGDRARRKRGPSHGPAHGCAEPRRETAPGAAYGASSSSTARSSGYRGLLAAGARPDDPALRSACRWLLDRQRGRRGMGRALPGLLYRPVRRA